MHGSGADVIDKTIGIIGCGHMGEALLSRLVRVVDRSTRLMVSEPDQAKRDHIQAVYKIIPAPDNHYLCKYSQAIIIAVKPQDIDRLLKDEICCDLSGEKLLISIAAGITTTHIEAITGAEVPVVRVMPNLPALIGEGVSGIAAGSAARAADLELARQIFATIGDVVEVREGLMDAVTAVSGSGPAYFFYLMEHLIASAVSLGIDEATARRLVVKTAAGSAKLVESLHEDPAHLRRKVASKGGTTEAAIAVFESRGFGAIVKEATAQAERRSRELSKR